MRSRRDTLRIANCSGYHGDRLTAAREMVEGGPIDVLTGDYLAEPAALARWRAGSPDPGSRTEPGRGADPGAAYAPAFLAQMRDVLGMCLERGVKVVANAGGLAPADLAGRVRDIAAAAGLHPRVAHVEGHDLLDRLPQLQAAGHEFAHLATGRPLAGSGVRPLGAHAVLGGRGIAEALRAGADVVVCGQVSGPALVTGPAAWAHDWSLDDWDALAGAVAAGHILAGGTQATGGNYAFFTEIPDPVHPGFPLAEVAADGSSVITKHPGTGGTVTVGTVTAQLLHGVDRARFPDADVVARLDTLRLTQQGPDRVAVGPAIGEPAPARLRVQVTHHGGHRNSATLVLTGLDLDAKAGFAEATLRDATGGPAAFAGYELRREHGRGRDRLTLTVRDPDPETAGPAFHAAVTGAALAGYPGMYVEQAGTRAVEEVLTWPTSVPAGEVRAVTVLADGTRVPVPRPRAEPPDGAAPAEARPALPVTLLPGARADAVPPEPLPPLTSVPGGAGPRRGRTARAEPYRPGSTRTVRLPLGTLAGARSAGRGGDATLGVWARDDRAYEWLCGYLDVPRMRALLPESARLPVSRHELPNLRAVSFVLHGLRGTSGEGAVPPAADPQAMALGERLRGCLADIPEHLVDLPQRPYLSLPDE